MFSVDDINGLWEGKLRAARRAAEAIVAELREPHVDLDNIKGRILDLTDAVGGLVVCRELEEDSDG